MPNRSDNATNTVGIRLDDLFVPDAQIEQLARGLAGKHRTRIEDSGHAVLIENGPDVAAAMRLFLRGIEQSAA